MNKNGTRMRFSQMSGVEDRNNPKDFGDCMIINSPRKSTLNGGQHFSAESFKQSNLNSGGTNDKNLTPERLPGIYKVSTQVHDTNQKIVGSVYGN